MNHIQLPNPKRFEITYKKDWKELSDETEQLLVGQYKGLGVEPEALANQTSYRAQMNLDHPYDEVMEITHPLFEQVSLSQRFDGFHPDQKNPEYIGYLLDVIVYPDQKTEKNTEQDIINNFKIALEKLNEVWTQAGYDYKSL